ncbi:MAG: ABC transporter permease [Chloroflexota bacterium]
MRRIDGAAAASLLALVAVAAVALLAPVISPANPYEQHLLDRLTPPFWLPGGNMIRPLGADDLGRDVLSRVMYGSRVSLLVGLGATALGLIMGSALGLLAGFRGGFAGEAIMLLADAQLALPFLLLAIAIIAVVGPGLGVLIALAGISGWTHYARVVRGQVLALIQREFVLAARAIGAADGRVMLVHILPNLVGTLVVLATLQLASVILLESTLSFLGLGIQPPEASWGSMLGAGREYLSTAWWISVFPGSALMVTVLAVGVGGDWLRDRLDPGLSHERG